LIFSAPPRIKKAHHLKRHGLIGSGDICEMPGAAALVNFIAGRRRPPVIPSVEGFRRSLVT
jgi:hypothetical protein